MTSARNETCLANPDFKRCSPNIFSPFLVAGLGLEPRTSRLWALFATTASTRDNKNSQKMVVDRRISQHAFNFLCTRIELWKLICVGLKALSTVPSNF